MAAGRNEPCPCGSGRKYKRCCLGREEQLGRLVSELEEAVQNLGRSARLRHREHYIAGFAEFYTGGLDAFGPIGPDREERLEAELWLVLDRALQDGLSILDEARRDEADAPALDALADSRIRSWKVGSVAGSGLISAVCPVSGEPATLEVVRPPAGEVREGSLLVARSVPRGGGRWALLGRAPVVYPSCQSAFLSKLAALASDETDFWRRHGGELAATAWAWPEEREHTFDGELVADASLVLEVRDEDAFLERLDSLPAVTYLEDAGDSEASVWRWNRLDAHAPVEMPAEPGVAWILCEEDAGGQPLLARLEYVWEDGELWVFAPTPTRLALAERAVRETLGDLLGAEPVRQHLDRVEIIPRWKRERWERTLARMAPRLRRREPLRALAA